MENGEIRKFTSMGGNASVDPHLVPIPPGWGSKVDDAPNLDEIIERLRSKPYNKLEG